MCLQYRFLGCFLMDINKTKLAFFRRVYVAYLIDTVKNNQVPDLMVITGFSRRTLQSVIEGLSDYCIDCEYVKTENRYVIKDWASVQKKWVVEHIEYIKQELDQNSI